ncbi:MAG TPA: hypothetical protein DHV60_07095 [Verrucomicrobiales bacterium]|nr:hypothetical protein [Verrucomicrobiales bacterium]
MRLSHGILSFIITVMISLVGNSPAAIKGEADVFKELDETYITATARLSTWLETPGSGILLKRSDFFTSGGNDLGDLVRYDPTINAPFSYASGDGTFGYGQTGYSGFNIRGSEGNRILMLVDGIRQPEAFVSTSFAQDEGSQGGAGRDYYDPAMFETTEILKGSASALYGSDALGGVVAFRTPNPDDFLKKNHPNYGGLLREQYFGVNESFATQGFLALRQNDWRFLLGYAGRDGVETTNNGKLKPNPQKFHSDNYLLKINWQPSNIDKLAFTFENFYRNRFVNAISANGFTTPFNKEILNWEEQHRNRYSLRWIHKSANNVWFDEINTHAYYQDTSNESRNHSESVFGRIRDQSISFNTSIYGIQNQLKKRVGRHDLTYGTDFSESQSENHFQRTDNGLPFDRNRTTFAPTKSTRLGLFIQSQYQSSDTSTWTWTMGLRADYFALQPDVSGDYLARINTINAGRNNIMPAEDIANLTFSPRLAASYKISDTNTAYLEYSYGVRNPTAEEISMVFDHPPSAASPVGTITLPNPDLKEERNHNIELGYKNQSAHNRFSCAVYYNRYSNLIENGVITGNTAPDGRDILTTLNSGTAEIYGYELTASWQLEKLTSRMKGLEFGVTTGRSWGVNREKNTWLNSIDPWKSSAWIGYTSTDDSLGTRLTAIYVDAVKHVDDSSGGPFFRPPSYFTLDLSAYWKITENLTLQAGVINLLDEQYWTWGSSRRGGGHITNSAAITDRTTAPGTHGFISASYQF